MNGVLLGVSFVLAIHLIFFGWKAQRNSRVPLIERHIGASSNSAGSQLIFVFVKLHRFLAGEYLNPWGTDDRIVVTLRHSQDERTLMQFRRSQLLCMLSLQTTIIVWSMLRNLGHRNISLTLLLLLLIAAVPASGWALFCLQQNKVLKIQQTVDQQLGGVLELLAFSVSAGEPIVLAIERVAKLCSGPLAQVLSEIPRQLAGGVTVTESLSATANQTSSTAFNRSIRAMQTALDRGTPIAGLLRAQAMQARSANQQHLLELAGRKEAAMMVPVVFFILPMIVFIALYPGLSTLQLA